MAKSTVPHPSDAEQLSVLLDSPEVVSLVSHLDARRWTGPPRLPKYRCSSGECSPASVWIKADRLHTLIPRETDRWKALYRRRVAVERTFGRLKHEWALLALRIRGIDRLTLHVDLTILAQLASALADARAVPPAV